MQTDLVPLRDDAMHQPRKPTCVLNQHEKRCMCAMLRENVENPGGPLTAGTVIEGQRHEWLTRPHASDRPPTVPDDSIDSTVRGALQGTLAGKRIVHFSP